MAAHVAGVLADVTEGSVNNLVAPSAVARQIISRLGTDSTQIADELRRVHERASDLLSTFTDETWAASAPRGVEGTIAEAVQAVWHDVWLHADDIRAAARLSPERGDGLRASVYHLANRLLHRGWSGELRLDGHPSISLGDRQTVTGDAYTFVLAATRRIDARASGYDESIVADS